MRKRVDSPAATMTSMRGGTSMGAHVTRRRIRSRLGIVILPALLTVVAFTGVAVAQSPTLTGELFETEDPSFDDLQCDPAGTIEFDLGGVATGPYEGRFSEQGSLRFNPATGEVTSFQSTFSIETTNDFDPEVTGEKSFLASTTEGTVDCEEGSTGSVQDLGYTAVLPDGSSDEGLSTVNWTWTTTFRQFTEDFVSTRDSEDAGPQSKEDCRNGGYERFGYKNQGQCIKDVSGKGQKNR
jgi:hypothetical protein